MSAHRPKSWLTSGWSLRKSTGSFFYLLIFQLLGLAGPVPEPEMQAAHHQLRKSKLQLHVSAGLSPSVLMPAHTHTHTLRAAPVANPALPSHPLHQWLCCWTGTFWMRECEAITCQEHFRLIIFPNIWTYGKRTTCYLTALLDFASVYFQPSVVAPREFCTVHIFPQYGAKIIHFILQKSWLYIL